MSEFGVTAKYIKFLEDFIIFTSNISNRDELYRLFISRILNENELNKSKN